MTIWRMRITCRITKAINTLRICNAYCFSTATIATRTRLNIMLYVHCLYYSLSASYTTDVRRETYVGLRTELILFEINQNWNFRQSSAISVLSRGNRANAMGLLLRSVEKALENRILYTARVCVCVWMYVWMDFASSQKKKQRILLISLTQAKVPEVTQQLLCVHTLLTRLMRFRSLKRFIH
jgi:hypothetical protein